MPRPKSLTTTLNRGYRKRWRIFVRDGFRCQYCGRPAGPGGSGIQVDHMVSVSDGGSNRIDNLVTACLACNQGKSGDSYHRCEGESHVRTVFQAVVGIKAHAFGTADASFSPEEAGLAVRLMLLCGYDGLEEIYRRIAHEGHSQSDTMAHLAAALPMYEPGGAADE